jgi:hypothetical protein
MNNAKMTYFKEDVLYLAISEGQETGSVELYPNVFLSNSMTKVN